MHRPGLLSFALLLWALPPRDALAEGVGDRGRLPSTAARLFGATTVLPLADGGAVSLGGPALRRLSPGAQRWETLHLQPGDNLYRVAADDAGRLLASWERDRHVHFFSKERGHVTFPRPAPQGADGAGLPAGFQVHRLAFAHGGRDALVLLRGSTKQGRTTHAAFRVPLDGAAPAELLFRDEALLVDTSPRGAVFAVPEKPGQACTRDSCFPLVELVAYELGPRGVQRRVLLDLRPLGVSLATTLATDDDEQVAVELQLSSRKRGLAVWRYGEARAEYRPLSGSASFRGAWSRALYSPSGELVEVAASDEELRLSRQGRDGRERSVVLAAPPDDNPDEALDTHLYGVGLLPNGTPWVHWGDHLLFFDAERPARSVSLLSLLNRQSEWAGAAIPVKTKRSVWLGIEVGRSRDLVRLDLEPLQRRATPWPWSDLSKRASAE